MSQRRRFLVLHGWQSRRPPDHWHWWLTEELRSRGEQVLYPQLPEPDAPSLGEWLAILHAELAQLGDGERVVVAHSLSCNLWLHAVAGLAPTERVDRVLLVAPPSPLVLGRYAEVADFVPAPADPADVEAAAMTTRLVCGTDDPYAPEGGAAIYPDLGVPVDVIEEGAHLNPDSGYGPWPSMLAWCLDPAAVIEPRERSVPR